MRGLDGVYVAETRISYVDGEKGRLWYRGYAVDELARKATFEEVAYLLIHGKLPNREELEEFRSRLIAARRIPEHVIEVAEKLPQNLHVLDKMRVLVTLLYGWYGDGKPRMLTSKQVDAKPVIEAGTGLVGAAPRLLGIIAALEEGRELPSEKFELDSHAAYTLYALTGREPSLPERDAFNTLLILYADHELPASTFAAMVAASTLTDIYSAIDAALATLKGPLHGGALEEVAKMLLEIGDPENAEKYVENVLSSGKRLMGFGHRVYKTYDPRSLILKKVASIIANAVGGEARRLYETAVAVENAALKRLARKNIYPNVDFWASVLLYALGIKPRYYTGVFAVARIVGWVAHVAEYVARNRLIRPRALYTGPLNLPYLPLEARQ
ncbi:Citrate (Si)-synthase [Pyrolobus fumarii 1A]|uniref:Citrate synthase n=1 Tax=Pyrolobus fumarii (strain DSM 11204 / 1A) TaxID=694429 RepID=G0EGE5_PYRF1|nr:citrate/2-methylcitrate synthase [Pyrolobus fumarii]AEM39170.1 Citrate (Si)-synthase [Pyrolobus fumarii 1A]